jgi:hypothetical protein
MLHMSVQDTAEKLSSKPPPPLSRSPSPQTNSDNHDDDDDHDHDHDHEVSNDTDEPTLTSVKASLGGESKNHVTESPPTPPLSAESSASSYSSSNSSPPPPTQQATPAAKSAFRKNADITDSITQSIYGVAAGHFDHVKRDDESAASKASNKRDAHTNEDMLPHQSENKLNFNFGGHVNKKYFSGSMQQHNHFLNHQQQQQQQQHQQQQQQQQFHQHLNSQIINQYQQKMMSNFNAAAVAAAAAANFNNGGNNNANPALKYNSSVLANVQQAQLLAQQQHQQNSLSQQLQQQQQQLVDKKPDISAFNEMMPLMGFRGSFERPVPHVSANRSVENPNNGALLHNEMKSHNTPRFSMSQSYKGKFSCFFFFDQQDLIKNRHLL